MQRTFAAACALLLTMAVAGCGPGDTCSGTCGASFSFGTSPLVISSTAGVQAPPVQVQLSGTAGAAFAISCDGDFTVTPTSGALAGGSIELSLQPPLQPVVGTFRPSCTVAPTPGAQAAAQLSIIVVNDAPIPDAGPPAGPVGADGGSVDHLYFAVVGDSRPNDIDVVSEYPTAVITQIYQDIEAMNPRPQFVVGTGDYIYANTNAYTAQPQASLYMQARAAYSWGFFPAMGNHECDGYTADNCTVNQTQNNQVFMQTILGPLGISLPYYSIPISAPDNSWTAKLVVIACNAWDSTQQAWLDSTLAQATTYTLLVRHEPAEANTGPCVNSVEQEMTAQPYDLSLVGHTHEFKGQAGVKEIVVGNGGAPLDNSGTFGYVTVERLSSGWQIIDYDASTALPVTSFLVP